MAQCGEPGRVCQVLNKEYQQFHSGLEDTLLWLTMKQHAQSKPPFSSWRVDSKLPQQIPPGQEEQFDGGKKRKYLWGFQSHGCSLGSPFSVQPPFGGKTFCWYPAKPPLTASCHYIYMWYRYMGNIDMCATQTKLEVFSELFDRQSFPQN